MDSVSFIIIFSLFFITFCLMQYLVTLSITQEQLECVYDLDHCDQVHYFIKKFHISLVYTNLVTLISFSLSK